MADVARDHEKKAGKARFPYFKFYPRDWLEGTRRMSLEQRGAYIDLICMMMEEEGQLRDEERLISAQMVISTRKWRSVRDQLVEHKKIHVEGGLIIQERCLRELDSMLVHRRVSSESALNREQTKREKSKNTNGINETDTTIVPLRARVTTDSDSDKKERTPSSPPEGGSVKGDDASQFGKVAAAVAASMIATAMPLAAEPATPPTQMQFIGVDNPDACNPAPEPRRRGSRTRLAADWQLPQEWRTETRAKFGVTDFQIDRQIDRFRRYWTGPDCPKPLKADWKATWLNSIDSAQTRGMLGPALPPSQQAAAPEYQNGRRVVIVDGRRLLV